MKFGFPPFVATLEVARLTLRAGLVRRPGVNPRPGPATIALAVLLGSACLAAGCRIPGYGPKAQSIIKSRQLSQRGVAALDRQDYRGAEPLFSQAVAACPVDVEARRQYAETLWHRGAREEAITQLVEATKIAPEDARLVERLAEFRLLSGQIDDARRDVELAIDLDPKSGTAWMVRGRIMHESGDNAQALADLHRALSYDPRNAQILHELAATYLAVGQPQRALANLEAMRDLHAPGDEPPDLLVEIGQACAGVGRYDDAVENYQRALAHQPANPDICYRLSEAELARGRTFEARQALDRAMAKNPTDPRYQDLLARLPGQGNAAAQR